MIPNSSSTFELEPKPSHDAYTASAQRQQGSDRCELKGIKRAFLNLSKEAKTQTPMVRMDYKCKVSVSVLWL